MCQELPFAFDRPGGIRPEVVQSIKVPRKWPTADAAGHSGMLTCESETTYCFAMIDGEIFA